MVLSIEVILDVMATFAVSAVTAGMENWKTNVQFAAIVAMASANTTAWSVTIVAMASSRGNVENVEKQLQRPMYIA